MAAEKSGRGDLVSTFSYGEQRDGRLSHPGGVLMDHWLALNLWVPAEESQARAKLTSA